jgi:hypothetical protein
MVNPIWVAMGTIVQYPQKRSRDYTKAQLAFFKKRNRRIEVIANKLKIEDHGLGTLYLLDRIDDFLKLARTQDNYQTEERIARAEAAYEALPEDVKKARKRLKWPLYH